MLRAQIIAAVIAAAFPLAGASAQQAQQPAPMQMPQQPQAKIFDVALNLKVSETSSSQRSTTVQQDKRTSINTQVCKDYLLGVTQAEGQEGKPVEKPVNQEACEGTAAQIAVSPVGDDQVAVNYAVSHLEITEMTDLGSSRFGQIQRPQMQERRWSGMLLGGFGDELKVPGSAISFTVTENTQ